MVNHPDRQYGHITFPKEIRTTKCVTHTHRHIYHDKHGLHIFHETAYIKPNRKHGLINCIPLATTTIR